MPSGSLSSAGDQLSVSLQWLAAAVQLMKASARMYNQRSAVCIQTTGWGQARWDCWQPAAVSDADIAAGHPLYLCFIRLLLQLLARRDIGPSTKRHTGDILQTLAAAKLGEWRGFNSLVAHASSSFLTGAGHWTAMQQHSRAQHQLEPTKAS